MPFLRGLKRAAEIYAEGPEGLLRAHAEKERDKGRTAELTRFMSEHPDQADTIAELGKKINLNLDFARPTNSDLLSGENKKIAADPYSATESSIVRDVKPLGRDLTEPTFSQTDRYNTTLPSKTTAGPDNAVLPSTQYGPEQRPEIKDLMAQAAEGRSLQDAEVKRKLGITKDTFSAQAEGSGLGAGKARHANAPTDLADKIQEIVQTGPPLATAAGLRSGSEFDAQHTPARMSADAQGHGMNAGAEARATDPIISARQKEQARYQNELNKDLEDYKSKTNLTSATKTMMEGAQMVLPHVNNLRVMAEALDKAGYFGPIMSRVRELGAKAGTVEEWEQSIQNDPFLQRDRSIGQFATELGLMASGAARVHGGARGGGSPMMLNYMKGLLSDASSLDMFEGRMDALEGYMKGYAGGPHAAPQPPPSVNIDPVGASALDKLRNR